MINEEAFRFIELKGAEGVTAKELAEKLGLKERYAASWLSKWAKRGYLKHVPFSGHVPYTFKRPWQGGRPKGSAGRYVTGDKWWGDRGMGEQDEYAGG